MIIFSIIFILLIQRNFCVFKKINFNDFIQRAKLLNLVKSNFKDEIILQCFQDKCVTLQFDNQLQCLEECLNKIDDKQDDIFLQQLNQISKLPLNYCLNGKDPLLLTKKEILLEFAKSDCSPIILVPGLLATKLIIQIDCEELRKNDPETFTYCGWNSCDPTKRFVNVPKQEYRVWIPSITSPISIFSISEKPNNCFAKVVRTELNFKGDVKKDFIQPRKGIKISIYGFTEQTKSENKCGAEASTNYLPYSMQTSASKGFAPLLKGLERIGYQNGLNLQVIPYNFFYSYKKNELLMVFEKNLDRLFNITQKKVSLIGHSFGTVNILYNLSKQQQKVIEEKVENFLAIAPPFLGSYEALIIMISGYENFQVFSGKMGFHFDASVQTFSRQLSLYELIVKDGFSLYEGEDWFSNVIKRIKYENSNGYIDYKDSGILFWPKVTDKCYPKQNVDFYEECLIGIDNSSLSFLKIGEQEFTLNDINYLFKEYSTTSYNNQIFQKLYNEEIAYIYPRVPTVVLYLNTELTTNKYFYKGDFQEKIKQKKYPMAYKTNQSFGDGTVPTFSTLLPALRWAFRYEQTRKDSNILKPVIFAEFCSLKNNQENIYQFSDEKKGKWFEENKYIGVKCKCLNQQKNSDCKHNVVQNDPYSIQFIEEFLQSAPKITDEKILDKIRNLKEEDLIQALENCDHLLGSIFDQAKQFNQNNILSIYQKIS